jgi:hypothetical protein
MNDQVVLVILRWLLALFGRAPLDPMPPEITFAVKLLLVLGASLLGVGLVRGLGRLWRRVYPRRP